MGWTRRWIWTLLLVPALAGADSPGEMVVTGTVNAAGGAGLGNVRVELLPFLEDYRSGELVLEGRLEPEPVAAAITDGEGRFHLRAPAAGLWRVVAGAPGYVPMHFRTLALVESRELPAVELRRDHGFRVRVLSATGGPQPDAWVWAESAADSLWSASAATDWAPAFRARRTDRRGAVVLPAAKGEELEITVRPRSGDPQVRKGRRDLELRVDGDGIWRWIAVGDASGRPASGVLVRGEPLAWPLGLTGADGRLRVAWHGGGPLVVDLVTPAGDKQQATVPLAAEGSADPPFIALREPIVLAGRIVDAATRKAIPNALVWSGIDPGAFVRADGRGRYRLRASTSDRFWIQAEAPSYVPEAVWLGPQDFAAGRVPSLALTPAVGVRGQVVDAAGVVISGAHLAAVERRPSAASYFRSGGAARRSQSAKDGRFELPSLGRGGSYDVAVSRPGYAETQVQLVVPRAPRRPHPLAVVLAPAGSGAGRVIDEEERPVRGVEVIVTVAGRGVAAQRGSPDDPFRGKTDAAGRFELARLPASRVDLAFSRDGLAPMTLRGVVVAPGDETFDFGTVMMVAAAAAAGRVVDEAGEGVAGAAIHVLRSERPERLGGRAEQWIAGLPAETQSDGEGRFDLHQLTPGERIHLLVRGEGFSPVWLHGLEIPVTEPVEIVLARGGRLAGRVLDPDGEPVSGAEVVFEQQEKLGGGDVPRGPAAVRDALSAADGGFVFAGLRAIPGTLTVYAPGLVPPAPLALEVSAAEPVDDLEIRLERGAVITGRTATRSGEPVAGAQVLAGQPTALSDAEGVFRIAGVPPGRVRVEARHPHYGRLVEELEVEPGTNTVEFLFADGYQVLGRVLDRQGAALAGVLVELSLRRESERRHHQTWSEIDGSFGFAAVTDGVYDVRAARRGYATAEVADGVRVAGGPVAGIEVLLEHGAAVSGGILGLGFDELARVRVRAVDAAGGISAGEIDYRGRYRISDLAPGEWLIQATLADGKREARARLTLLPGDGGVERDLEFRPGVYLCGQIRHNGVPLPGTTVSLQSASAASRSVLSDRLGRFRIEDLQPGTYHLGLINAREHLTDNRVVELDAGREMIFDLRSASVGGRVVDAASSRPVASALISLRPLIEDAAAEGIRTAGSDGDGRFLLPRVPEGRYRLSVLEDGSVVAERELEVYGGIDVTDLELVLAQPPPAR